MGFINQVMQRKMMKRARKLAREVAAMYSESNSLRKIHAPVPEVVRDMIFDLKALARKSEKTRKRFETCCETVQGFCYMLALDVGLLKGMMNFRSLQFTHYMDKELEARGFPPQSKEQKARILEAMDLRIDGWDRVTGD